jgi:hypothetical protein
MCMRSTAATQAAQVSRVHWPGSVISGCSAASQRPMRSIWFCRLRRTDTGRVEVSNQRCTQATQDSATPCTDGGCSRAGGAGGPTTPSAASARCRPCTAWRSEYGRIGPARSSSRNGAVRSARSGLPLSSSA